MTHSLIERVQDSLGRRMAVWDSGNRTVIATAWTLEDGTPVTLYVTPLSDDLFNVSDAGLAAGALADVGVDLSARVAGGSFQTIQQGFRLGPSLGEGGEWDLAVSATADELGDAVIEVSEAVIRAEALRALAKKRPTRTFSDRIIRTAGSVGLKIEPHARLPLRYKNARRQVTYRLIGDHRDAYVQTITRASALSGYDHARALFSDADVDFKRRMAAIEGSVRLEEWQFQGLSEVCAVVSEDQLERSLADLAAA